MITHLHIYSVPGDLICYHAGAAAAYHLSQRPESHDIVVIETGRVGHGCSATVIPRVHSPHQPKEVEFPYAHVSGSATLTNTGTIKMMMQIYASSTKDFIRHHGEDGAREYLKLAQLGIQYQKTLAKKVFSPAEYAQNFQQLGSLWLGTTAEVVALREEYALLQRVGGEYVNVEWWDTAKLHAKPIHPTGPVTVPIPRQFTCAIFFPDDAVINSEEYARCLLRAAVLTGKVRVYANCPPVMKVDTCIHPGFCSPSTATPSPPAPPTMPTNATTTATAGLGSIAMAMTDLSNGTRVVSEQVVVCMGGLFTDTVLAGIMRPCWSYLVSLQQQEGDARRNRESKEHHNNSCSYSSPNMWTWDFSYDWCWSRGHCRISGEDGYSALKAPRARERCAALARWGHEMYPDTLQSFRCEDAPAPPSSPSPSLPSVSMCAPLSLPESACGVYSETPDAV